MSPGYLNVRGCLGSGGDIGEVMVGTLLWFIVDGFERGIMAGYCEGVLTGATMSHDGSTGVRGSDDEDMGRMRTTFELSHPCSILGE